MTPSRLFLLLALMGCKDQSADDTGPLEQTDADGDGAFEEVDDCDDGDATIHPGATEACDGIDNNCDGLVDEADPAVDLSTGQTVYADADGDTYGDASQASMRCTLEAGSSLDATDCDDGEPAVNPGASEVCDSVDNDCDDLVDADDPSALGTLTAYTDADSDGFGDPTLALTVCTLGVGQVSDNTDCDDSQVTVYPSADEDCGDELDNDCDGSTNEDCLYCSDLRVLAFYDSFSAGSAPIEQAATLGGFVLSATSVADDFASSFDGGGYEVVVVDIPGSAIPTAVSSRLGSAITNGLSVLFSYWYLGYDTPLATSLGVSVVSSFSTPQPLSATSGSSLWSIAEVLPSSIVTYSHDAGVNGHTLAAVDAGSSEILGVYGDGSSQVSILATYSGQVIVNGFLPWDYQATDDDDDGVLDMAELYLNELVWTTGCEP